MENPDGQICVLVVDDDPGMRRLISDILLADGHLVVAAESVEEALQNLVHFTFQVALVDHHLPGIQGLVFSEYLRGNNPHMEVALVTGADDANIERESEEHGIRYIAKPFDIGQIKEVVDAYCAGARERAAARRSGEFASSEYILPLSDWFGEVTDYYALPAAPSRIQDQLVKRIRAALAGLRSVARYNERDRVAAFSGLVAAQVLGVHLPKGSDGASLFEEYDRLMRSHGRHPEFGTEE